MTKSEFNPIYQTLRMAMMQPHRDGNGGETEDVYFGVLGSFTEAELSAGTALLMRERDRKWFPTTGEWLAAVDKAKALQALTPVAEPRGWTIECDHCDDTGWQRYFCPGDRTCGRPSVHASHDFVRVCSCRPTNRTWHRHHQAGSRA